MRGADMNEDGIRAVKHHVVKAGHRARQPRGTLTPWQRLGLTLLRMASNAPETLRNGKGTTMTQKDFAISLGFAGLLLILAAQGARAGPPCGPREQVVAHLAEKYAETRRAVGLAGNNSVMELYAAETTGTWTIAVTTPEGVTCLMASGQGFQAVTEELPAKGNPA